MSCESLQVKIEEIGKKNPGNSFKFPAVKNYVKKYTAKGISNDA
jgi:hypothetical protein